MNVKDLRIGNIIKDRGSNIPYFILGANKFKNIIEWDSLFEYEPIPLTEEWLLKFGFHKHNNAWVQDDFNENNNRFYFSIWSDTDEDFRYNSSEFDVELNYVHQLQNLYFALTNKELKK